VVEWARSRGFVVKRDAIGNLVVKVPATAGHEAAPAVILQGHLDMVCEKNADVERDFLTQGIEAYVDGDWVRRRGTTSAPTTASAWPPPWPSPTTRRSPRPLEILCTVDEETGLTGAKKLDGSMLSGRLMVNLDTRRTGGLHRLRRRRRHFT